MRVALVGYGKMGQSIEKILLERGHSISKTISIDNPREITEITRENTDVAIEFTAPEAACANVIACIRQGVPVVSGSTGWLDHFAEVEKATRECNGAFFYASNYSLGVNIFFKLNRILAQMMDGHDYETSMVEIHHLQKLDAPSGTAITLAEGLIAKLKEKNGWVNETSIQKDKIGIVSERIENVPGTHIVKYTSDIDTIEISHIAHSRKGFAMGAVLAAEWIMGKTGVFSMDDLLNL